MSSLRVEGEFITVDDGTDSAATIGRHDGGDCDRLGSDCCSCCVSGSCEPGALSSCLENFVVVELIRS